MILENYREEINERFQLEEIEIVVADHVQRVNKANFVAAWEQIGAEHEHEETFALSTLNSIPSTFFRMILDF